MTRPKALTMWAAFHPDDGPQPVLMWTRRGAKAMMPLGGRIARVRITELPPRKKARRG